ncbi:MAG TPA: M28 family peptidase [Gemmatimonadales bacterium]
MRTARFIAPIIGLFVATGAGLAAQREPPSMRAIRESDLRSDLMHLASDAMRGREAGTLDEFRASVWLAERAREAGLEPAGDDGTYFQFWPMGRERVSAESRISLAGATIPLNREAFVVQPITAQVDAPVVWIGGMPGDDLAVPLIEGKVVVADLVPPPTLPDPSASLWGFRYTLSAVRARAAALAAYRPAAIVLVSDSIAESMLAFVGTRNFAAGRYTLDSAAAPSSGPPVVWVSSRWRSRLMGAGRTMELSLWRETFTVPSVNVVARVTGTDRRLRHEHVLFSAHQDHDGVLPAEDGDSIWNGADDNASVAVALLAIGRAFAENPGRRSALFVWHGAEEKGLLGSRWHAAHPVVPADRIVAVLNADMIGRNHPDSAALLGVQPPHLNSPDLAHAALTANATFIGLALDTLWDRPDHPEGWYFRSDHLPYARRGIPAVYFSSLLHPDYHTPRDAPELIDIGKVQRMARWMYATGWMVAAGNERPKLLEGFALER